MTLLQPPASPSRAYRLALSGAVLLFLAVLTMALLIILLDNARQHNQREEFAATLTAVADDLAFEQVEVPTEASDAPLTGGEFPFVPHDKGVTYGAGDSCEVQQVGGQVLGADGQPTDAFAVLVWGDYLAPRLMLTGEIAGNPPGIWTLTVPGGLHRRVWVQITGAGRTLSAPVEVIFSAGDCAHNAAQVIFRQQP
ncbi:MAG: hypothetical protein Kow00106_17280 [Anaerolineae bacterium]